MNDIYDFENLRKCGLLGAMIQMLKRKDLGKVTYNLDIRQHALSRYPCTRATTQTQRPMLNDGISTPQQRHNHASYSFPPSLACSQVHASNP
jgi:hypothetical protein